MGKIPPGRKAQQKHMVNPHGTPLCCRFLSYESTLPPMDTHWDLGPATECAADHAPFDAQEAFVRAVTTDNHLIISEHMHFHGKNMVNLFLLIATLLNIYTGKWALMSSMSRIASRKILLPASQWKQSTKSHILLSCWRKERRAYNDMSKCAKPLCCQQSLCLGSQVSSRVYTLAVS